MTDARCERIPIDGVAARAFLVQARRFLRDGDTSSLSSESRHLLYYQAALTAADAILLAVGRRVSPGDGAHVLRFREAASWVGTEHEALFERLDLYRDTRNEVSYAASPASSGQVAALRGATGELLELAETFVAKRG